ncbi:MAG TPA: hypothetical protein LFV66_03900 [Rickettsia endosymbiont of Bembidion lapponicum]|nr:hypothetical protein [Rickettsia endosymbiont of Bembidion lapponicum]
MTKPSVIKLATPFERLKFHNPLPDIALRLAIIMQAIIDSTNTSPKKEAKKAEDAAKKWIFIDNEDFITICFEAGIEPSLVRKITKGLIRLQQNKSVTHERDLFCNKSLKLR